MTLSIDDAEPMGIVIKKNKHCIKNLRMGSKMSGVVLSVEERNSILEMETHLSLWRPNESLAL